MTRFVLFFLASGLLCGSCSGKCPEEGSLADRHPSDFKAEWKQGRIRGLIRVSNGGLSTSWSQPYPVMHGLILRVNLKLCIWRYEILWALFQWAPQSLTSSSASPKCYMIFTEPSKVLFFSINKELPSLTPKAKGPSQFRERIPKQPVLTSCHIPTFLIKYHPKNTACVIIIFSWYLSWLESWFCIWLSSAETGLVMNH